MLENSVEICGLIDRDFATIPADAHVEEFTHFTSLSTYMMAITIQEPFHLNKNILALDLRCSNLSSFMDLLRVHHQADLACFSP